MISRLMFFVPFLLFLWVDAQPPKTVDETINATYQIEEDAFVKRLFNGYRADKRPLGNKEAVDVVLNVYIHHISIPKVQNPTVRFNAIITMVWYDERLGWNPADENGRTVTIVPQGYRIWTPFVHFLAKGYTSRLPIHAFKSRGTKLRVSDPNRFRKAKVTLQFRFDGSFDCEASGSFPFEQMTCTARFVAIDYFSKVRLRIAETELFVYRLAPTNFEDMIDTEHLNGWKMLSGVQKLRYFDPFNSTNMFKDNATDMRFGMMSMLECQMILVRDGWTLPIVVMSSVLASAFILICSWVTPVRWSIFILISLIYSISVCVRLSLSKVVILSDDLPGLDLFIIGIWISCCLSLLLHLIFQYFPYETKQRVLTFSPLLRRWSFFKRLEETLAAKEKTDMLSLELDAIRTIVALLLVCSLSFSLLQMQ